MLPILKAHVNEVVVTLTELTTISPAYYLFEFQNDSDKVKHYFTMPDTSAFTYRYNKFELEEGVTVTLPLGFGKYTVYAQSDPFNIDPENATEVVEVGKFNVTTDPEEIKAYDQQLKTYIIYG